MALRERNSALYWAATRPEDNTPAVAVAVRPLRCVLGMFSSLRVQVPAQPDGGEGLARTQGLPPRGGV